MRAASGARRLRAALVVLLVAAGLLAALGGDASLSGAWDKRAYGCVCHSPLANASVLIDVKGFPPRYDLGGAYTIDVRLLSTPVNASSNRMGGFNAEVSQGAFSIPAALDAFEQAYGNQASHREPGTNLTNWTFTWLAPAAPSGVATLWVTVNTVNGNGVPDAEDKWVQVRLESVGPSPDTGGGGGLGALTSGGAVSWVVFGAAAFGGGAVSMLFWKSRRGDGAGPAPSKKRHGRRRARKRAKEEAPHPPRGRGRTR